MSNVYKVKIIGSEENDNNNFYCQICDYPIITRNDIVSSKKYDCCNDCYITLIEARKKDWCNGWRPKQKKVDSYIKTKVKVYQKVRRLK